MRLSLEERVSGGLFGVVVGDALGLPIQFEARETVRKHPVTGMQGFGAFNLPVGSWSDDSSLTLCLLTSLSEKGYDLEDIGQRFLRWYREGYLTPFGKAFDVGWTTEMAMERLEQGVPALEAGLKEERSNGNGSLMRILPAALFFAHDPDEALVRKVSDISRITHAHRRSQLACSLYALLVKELLAGSAPIEAYQRLQQKAKMLFASDGIGELEHFRRILDGELLNLPEAKVCTSGYVIDSLEAAIWCFLHSQSFAEAVLLAVNLGEDTDTVGAITGGLAGTCYGRKEIPREWLEDLVRYRELEVLIRVFVERVQSVKNIENIISPIFGRKIASEGLRPS